ncbi:MAG TPA: hypothetical protein VF234_03605, partial [Limnochordia bacterium]
FSSSFGAVCAARFRLGIAPPACPVHGVHAARRVPTKDGPAASFFGAFLVLAAPGAPPAGRAVAGATGPSRRH